MSNKKSDETLLLIRKRLRYDPVTGYFHRLVKYRQLEINSIAGSLVKTESGQIYVEIGICGYRYLAHILAYWFQTGVYPDSEIDHKNGIGTENDWDNLRKATRTENATNVAKHKDGECLYKGVYRDRQRGGYRSFIMHRGKNYFLGRFDTQEKARDAYLAKSLELHKEFSTMRGSEGYAD